MTSLLDLPADRSDRLRRVPVLLPVAIDQTYDYLLPDGLGLGLSICANIVHAHGGGIWLQSSAGGATEFRFSLPLQPET